MNLQDYISTGIIESYTLGMATEKEAAEFEALCLQYPALKQARIEFEEKLEQQALSNAVKPAPELKEKIWAAIQESAPAKVIPIGKHVVPVKKINKTWWAVAASVLVIVTAGFLVYNNYQKNERLKYELARSEEKLETLDGKTRAIEERMLEENGKIKQVSVVTPQQAIPATINVYGDSTSTDVYLVIRDLVPLAKGQQYQLWSIKNKKYNSLGLFDAPANDKLILRMSNVQDADSFAITINQE